MKRLALIDGTSDDYNRPFQLVCFCFFHLKPLYGTSENCLFQFRPMRVHPRAYVCTDLKEQANSRENINWSELINQTIEAKKQPAWQELGGTRRLLRRLSQRGIFESNVILNKREITNTTHIREKLKIINFFKSKICSKTEENK